MTNCCTPVSVGGKENVTRKKRTNGNQQSTPSQRKYCPHCGHLGKKVDTITLKAMLDVSLLSLRDKSYRFCRSADCSVVYFAGDGSQIFSQEQLRLRVHQKAPDDDTVPVCYCFRHSPASIRADLQTTGLCPVVEEIKRGIEAGQCACQIRNPQGSCCLGNVQSVLRSIEQEGKETK